MVKVSNKKCITNIAIKSFKASHTRNRIAVIAIALTTILFTSLFTIGIGIVETIQNQTMRQAGGDGHIVLKYLSQEQYEKFKAHPLIDRISYNKTISDHVDNPEFLKRHVEMYYMDSIAMELGFCTPTVGGAPTLENDIAMDTASLDLLGIPHELGSSIRLVYTIKGIQYETDFTLSGYWESDPNFNVGFGLVSEKFTKVHGDILGNTYKSDKNYTGSINAYIMCKNSFNLEEKMARIVTESGYTIDDGNESTPALPTDIACNTNWSYMSSGTMDMGSLGGIVGGLILIIATGYLIIFNVFQISVQRDIRFYGLLKTIGTTGKQIKKIVTKQALLLSVIGIPLGLGLGFLIGKSVLPMIMEISTYKGEVMVSINPIIFIGASLFSLFTVFLSTRKPCKIAAAVSPIEAVKYSGNTKIKKKNKDSKDGGKVYKMAFSNLGRNKKSTIITVISLCLSLVLLNTIFTISQGFDMDKYVAKFVDTDYLVGHANYFNRNHFRMPEDGMSDQMMQAIGREDNFLEGGKLYHNIYLGSCSIQRDNPNEPNLYAVNFSNDGMPMLDLYGLDQLPLSRLDIFEGEYDLKKLATGNYIIEGVSIDDDGSIHEETSHYTIGDMVTIHVDGKTYEYELLAKAKVKSYTNTNRMGSNYTMYLPSETYIEVVNQPIVMSYAFNIKKGTEPQMEAFLRNYTSNIEPMMDFESKAKYVNGFKDLQMMLLTVGGILSGIMALIGILNFVNSILTSIITRRREFATLQSIGMTKGQLIKMLIFESEYYVFFVCGISLLLGILLSVGIVGNVVSNLWFFTYRFTLLPLLCTYPILMILGLMIPYGAYATTQKQSIVERLREVE